MVVNSVVDSINHSRIFSVTHKRNLEHLEIKREECTHEINPYDIFGEFKIPSVPFRVFFSEMTDLTLHFF